MMENAYGIGITNRYSCFLRRASSDSEEDPEDALKSAEIGAKPKVKSAEKENRTEKVDNSQKSVADKTGATARKGIRDSNQKGTDSAKSTNRPISTGNEGQKPNRGPRQDRPHFDKEHAPRNDRPPMEKERGQKFSEEDREERNNRRNRDEGVRGDVDFGDRRGGGRGPGGGFRGDRRGAPRGVRGAPRKREFDRQSGSDKSGVKSVDKREGGGSRNWGTYKDEIDAEISGNQPGEEGQKEEKVEKDATDETGGEEKNENDESVNNGPAEPKLMTLEEWKALQVSQARQKPVFNLRKAGEGEDQSQWQNLTLKKKEKVEQDDEEYEEEEVADEYDCPQRAGRQKQVLEIDFHFADSRRGGPPGERRGGRGRGGFDRPERSERGGFDRPERSERGGGGERGDRSSGGERGGGERGRGGGRGFRREGGGGFRGGRGGRDDRPTRQAAPRVDDVNDFPSLG